ncbi:MAG: metal ABC transporter substrate-binding protein [Xanthobacteraceae bacterium]
MLTRRHLLLLAGSMGLLMEMPALGQDRVIVVTTFSILGDLVKNVGGDRVEVSTLVGPNGDVHVYLPTPGDARKLAAAKVVFVNGLGLEGWLTRLISASGTKASIVIASEGIKPRKMKDEHDIGDVPDAHAWQSVANAKIYIENIRDGFVAVDRSGEKNYQANATDYLAKLDALDAEIKSAIEAIPPARRKVITAHDAFGYFGDAYGVEFIAPEGLSTEAEPSAGGLAKLIDQIRREKISAVFMENVTDPHLAERIAEETGAKIGGTLYSDALSPPGGSAATYIEMMRGNARELTSALTS